MKIIFSALALLVISTSASAVTLDYRHEYKADSKTNADRLKMSHTTDGGYYASVEGRFAEGSERQNDGFSTGSGHFSGSGSEWEFGKSFQITDKLILAPGVNLDMGDDYVGYRLQIKAIYSITENWMTTFRWRPGVDVSENPNEDNRNYNQFNWEFGYVSEKFSVVSDYEYRFTNYDDYQGDHNYWLYNIVASMPIDKHWTPYTEIGVVPRYNINPSQDDMEMRYRLGIQYNF
ncbi:hypothetical protein A9993_12195 [Rahnella victoriana]|uniref:oligogalacturonate-specific porin KdgM family protein n=1 Tax=Rahnella victoriana TaxID=1510570 RepID=UPI000BB184CB|nr:oligogalacturonate-specific porin KdgM family protein [Rahnella victoriana]PBI80442.1 hypothetical protein A9993_12195 [Rahnella victoriana]